MLTRRALLGATAAAAVLPGSAWLRTRPSAAATTLKPYQDPLPIPPTARFAGTAQRGPYPGAPLYTIAARQLTQKFHRDLPPTTAWGYDGSFPGPVIRATSGSPLYVRWRNALPGGSHP